MFSNWSKDHNDAAQNVLLILCRP